MTTRLRIAAICVTAALTFLFGCASSGESAAFSNQQSAESPAAEAATSPTDSPEGESSASAADPSASAEAVPETASSAEAAPPSETTVDSEVEDASLSASSAPYAATDADANQQSADVASQESASMPASDESSASAPDLSSAESAASDASSTSTQATQDSSGPATVAASTQAASTASSATLADFPSWDAKSESLAQLMSFVESVTDETSPDYVEPQDRIATLDMDGTIFSEKDPVYIDYSLLIYRVLDDPTYEAPEPVKVACESIREYANKGVISPDYGQIKNEAFAQAFAGMTSNEFDEYVNEFLTTQKALGFSGMTYGEAFYKPMVEVIDYLRAHEFNLYIVSTCERETVRAIVCERLGIEPDHVIGSDLGTSATGQNGTMPESYTFEQDDTLVMDGTVLTENANMHKVVTIEREIGKRPILAFGNSTGDFAMLNYAASNDEHAGKGVLIIADDTEREYGDAAKAREMKASADDAGYIAVSMREDWNTIYGANVTKTALPASE